MLNNLCIVTHYILKIYSEWSIYVKRLPEITYGGYSASIEEMLVKQLQTSRMRYYCGY